MRSLLLVAHGSRRELSNDEVRSVTDKLRANAGKRFDMVECAFLELAEPSIPDGIEKCIQQGATRVDVLPYFLSAGRHVGKDIPECVALKQAEHPDVDIHLVTHLGAAAAIPELLLSMVE